MGCEKLRRPNRHRPRAGIPHAKNTRFLMPSRDCSTKNFWIAFVNSAVARGLLPTPASHRLAARIAGPRNLADAPAMPKMLLRLLEIKIAVLVLDLRGFLLPDAHHLCGLLLQRHARQQVSHPPRGRCGGIFINGNSGGWFFLHESLHLIGFLESFRRRSSFQLQTHGEFYKGCILTLSLIGGRYVANGTIRHDAGSMSPSPRFAQSAEQNGERVGGTLFILSLCRSGLAARSTVRTVQMYSSISRVSLQR